MNESVVDRIPDSELNRELSQSDDADPVFAIVPPAQPAILVNGVSIQYPIGPFVRGSLKSAIMRAFTREPGAAKPSYVTAIRRLNLTVNRGERVAIIGKNGAGKSTLLRTLAGIYPITRGSIKTYGDIGTLLDIGVGFEPEATGRENIYYRGMAMGHSPRVLKAAEEEIVNFANLGEFIDLPMRTYSSGMYVRLGFSVSTHFSPEILLIDEVFSAGDASFIKRALERVRNIVRKSGTMVCATHSLGLVAELCTRVVWLEKGVVRMDGATEDVLPEFRKFMAQP